MRLDTHRKTPCSLAGWRILGHSFGPMWNADPDDRAVLNEEYWEALENIPARALQLVGISTFLMSNDETGGSLHAYCPEILEAQVLDRNYVELLSKLRDYAET